MNNESKPKKYFFNLLISMDQLETAIAAGNPDNTISVRIGHFAHDEKQTQQLPAKAGRLVS
jgi:hypothetical protein